MELETQIAILEKIGISLNEGVNIDDLLYSFARSDYEKKPFDLILFVYGIEIEREPWGRYFSSNAWNFDRECIKTSGDYVTIVKKLCELSGDSEYLTNVKDYMDHITGEAWIKYEVNGNKRDWKISVCDDWADMMVISYIIGDIERNEKRFYYKDNGQAMIIYYLDSKSADELVGLSEKSLIPVNV